jgi:hypothetical protein
VIEDVKRRIDFLNGLLGQLQEMQNFSVEAARPPSPPRPSPAEKAWKTTYRWDCAHGVDRVDKPAAGKKAPVPPASVAILGAHLVQASARPAAVGERLKSDFRGKKKEQTARIEKVVLAQAGLFTLHGLDAALRKEFPDERFPRHVVRMRVDYWAKIGKIFHAGREVNGVTKRWSLKPVEAVKKPNAAVEDEDGEQPEQPEMRPPAEEENKEIVSDDYTATGPHAIKAGNSLKMLGLFTRTDVMARVRHKSQDRITGEWLAGWKGIGWLATVGFGTFTMTEKFGGRK